MAATRQGGPWQGRTRRPRAGCCRPGRRRRRDSSGTGPELARPSRSPPVASHGHDPNSIQHNRKRLAGRQNLTTYNNRMETHQLPQRPTKRLNPPPPLSHRGHVCLRRGAVAVAAGVMGGVGGSRGPARLCWDGLPAGVSGGAAGDGGAECAGERGGDTGTRLARLSARASDLHGRSRSSRSIRK